MIALNTQPPEKMVSREDGFLDIHSVFRTIQGEGPFTGCPSVFVRTAGCVLCCPACFHGKTVIRMGDFSTKLISEVRVGDSVLSYDEEEGKFVPRIVTQVMSKLVMQIYSVDNGANNRTYVTGEHPFLVRGKGWTCAKDLEVGDHVLHLSLSELRRLHNPMKDKETARRVSEAMKAKGLPCPWERMTEGERETHRRNLSIRMKLHNPMKDPEVAVKGFLARKDRGKQTTVEKFVLAIGSDFGLVFVGGGDLVVGCKVPDFVIQGTNKLVEVWEDSWTNYLGRDEEWMSKRRKVFEKHGYEVLFLPVTPYRLDETVGKRKKVQLVKRRREIARIRKLISEYLHNGSEILGVEKISPKAKPKSWARLAGTLDAPLTVYNLEVEGTHTYIANTMVVHNCDTQYTEGRTLYSPGDLLELVKGTFPPGAPQDLIVLTGGEPLRQDLTLFLLEAVREGFRVQIETAGTCPPPSLWDQRITIVCSPKTPRVNEELLTFIHSYKYVLAADSVDPRDGLPTSALGMSSPPARPHSGFRGEVFIQPQDDQDEGRNRDNTRAALESSMKFGYRLSLQLHKILGLE